MPRSCHAAVDLGAASGRVLVGTIGDDRVRLEEAHRFSYAPRAAGGHLRWDMPRLFAGLRTGLQRAARLAAAGGTPLRSAGVDAWGVDYGLIDERGQLLEDPVCYRDERTSGMTARALAAVPRETLFRKTGIQFLPFNTVFQLMAHVAEGLPRAAHRLLMIPDLGHHFLCGSASGEPTNASTTQLLNIETGDWDDDLFRELGLPRRLMPPLSPAGTDLGPLRGDLRRELDLPALSVIPPATHDTASAVAGTPLESGWAFISSGTWSLVGVERREPLVDARVLEANFTNERGVEGTFRFLKNVTGTWILESCRREWTIAGADIGLADLLKAVGSVRDWPGFIHPDDPRFFNPPAMLAAVRAALLETGQTPPDDPVRLTKVLLDSLALRYASVVEAIEQLTGEPVAGIHIVGGGSQNEYVNQATANATGRPVAAGPVEATGLGNVLIQAAACGTATLQDGRVMAKRTQAPARFDPANAAAWAVAKQRYLEMEAAARAAACRQGERVS